MAKCIYRGVTLNRGEPDSENAASAEHIVPYSLGGSNEFITNDASKKANNDLGSEVDAPFADVLPLAIKRHKLRINSQNGNINPIVWNGETAQGTRGTISIHADGKVDFDFDISVQRPPKGQGGQYIVAGTREKIEPILDGLLKGMRKRDERFHSMDGKLLDSVEDLLSESQVELIDKCRYRIAYFNHDAWVRGMLKIILGLGHSILGSNWTFGAMGNKIRQYVNNPRDRWPEVPLRGIIAGEWDRSVRSTLGKTALVKNSFKHTLAILPGKADGSAAAFVSLFGGNDVFEATVPIGRLPAHFIAALNDRPDDNLILGYRIDPSTRRTEKISYGYVNRNVARLGPTNRKSMSVYAKGSGGKR